MEFKFDYKAYEKGSKDVQKIERKIKAGFVIEVLVQISFYEYLMGISILLN
jgi:hypothetical protein